MHTLHKLEWKLISLEKLMDEASEDDFLMFAKAVSKISPSVILLSGGEHDSANFSIACWCPYLVMKTKNAISKLEYQETRFETQFHPIDLISRVMENCEANFEKGKFPFLGGAIGFISYEAKNYLENLPQNAQDDLQLPDLYFIWPQKILIHDRRQKELWFAQVSPENYKNYDSNSIERENLSKNSIVVSNLASNFSESDYIKAIKTIIDYIRNGHVYQVNLSQRFSFYIECEPFETWISLFKRNPAPFYAFVNGGDFFILSTSMERFIFVRDNYIETRPIKGTRPRGKTANEDTIFKNDLLNHPKDDAELSMIVDLLRNDLGKVCKPGTVHVAEHKRLEKYKNVFHLISIITGELHEDIGYGDIIKAVFPGGSITGCPKIRSMEIIDELEPNVRHVYTGCIGYWGFHKNMDTNIAIRTMIIKDSVAYLSVGGGIVFDSNPRMEYEETLHKGRTFFEVLKLIHSS